MPIEENRADVNKLEKKYLKIAIVFFLLGMIYLLWTITVIVTVVFFDFEFDWAGLTIDQWIISSIIIFSIFLVIEIIFLLHHSSTKKKQIESEKPKPLLYKGKRLHKYTVPTGSKGGIFSKTFVKIDDQNILYLRYQMIPPNDLWGKKEKKLFF